MPCAARAHENAAKLGLNIGRLSVLERFTEDFFKNDLRQGGVIRVCVHGVPVFEGSYGYSARDYGLRQDTIFPVASISKPIISTLLHILQEDGLVDLTYPVKRYLPEFDGDGRENIMLWHFLTHTSGLMDEEISPAYFEYAAKEFGLERPKGDAPREQWMDFYKTMTEKMGLVWGAPQSDRLNDAYYLISLKTPPLHKPRSHMTYCNYGYQRLKEIIDVITDEPIDSFARRVLFEPLGMSDTHFVLPKDKWDRVFGVSERARGYPYWNTEDCYRNESGSGGLKSTTHDMSNFTEMIVNGGVFKGKRILSKASVRQMLANHNEGVPSSGETGHHHSTWSAWGLGWNCKETKKDDAGMLRSSAARDHGGYGGTRILLDPDISMTATLLTATYEMDDSVQPPFLGPFFNILYSAFE